MSRIITSSFAVGLENWDERLGTDGDVEGASVPVLDTSVVRAGGTSVKFNTAGTASNESYLEWNRPGTAAVVGRGYFLRAYINLPNVTPTAEFNMMTGENSAVGSRVAIRLTTTGTLILSNRRSGVQIGSASPTLVANTWYRVEMYWKVNAAANVDEAAFYLDGTLIASSTAQNLNNNIALDRFELGFTTTPNATNFLMYATDVAFNDDQGASQNSYPGSGVVTYLKPVSDNQVGSWTGGAGGGSNLFDALDNKPPVGVATGSETNTSQIKTTQSNQSSSQEYRANLTSFANGGIGVSDSITLIHPVLWHAEGATGNTKTGSFGGVSNPAWTYDTFTFGDDQGAAGTWNAQWRPVLGSVQYAPTVTLSSNPIVAINNTTASGTDEVNVCAMGLYVEYIPVFPTATGQPRRGLLSVA